MTFSLLHPPETSITTTLLTGISNLHLSNLTDYYFLTATTVDGVSSSINIMNQQDSSIIQQIPLSGDPLCSAIAESNDSLLYTVATSEQLTRVFINWSDDSDIETRQRVITISRSHLIAIPREIHLWSNGGITFNIIILTATSLLASSTTSNLTTIVGGETMDSCKLVEGIFACLHASSVNIGNAASINTTGMKRVDIIPSSDVIDYFVDAAHERVIIIQKNSVMSVTIEAVVEEELIIA